MVQAGKRFALFNEEGLYFTSEVHVALISLTF